jgi:hypothetical protein
VTLPALITVTGTIRSLAGPQAGRFTFTRSTVIFPSSSSDDNYLIPEEVVATVGVDGQLSVALYAGNDPVASPTGWTWWVQPHFPSWKTPFSILVPYDAPGGTIDLNDLAPVPEDGTGALYALLNHTHPGGGSVTYGSVTAQTTYAAASSSGAADSVSRSDHRHGTPVLPTPTDIGAAASGHTHTGTYDPAGTATSAVAAHVAASDPHTQYSRINYWNGSAYVVVTGAEIYVGGTGPAVPTNGDVWFSS